MANENRDQSAKHDPFAPPAAAGPAVDPTPDAQAEYWAGLVLSARSAREKAEHEAYNDPVALASRIEAEFGDLDPKLQEAVRTLTADEPRQLPDDLESLALQKAIKQEIAGEDEAVEAQPRADKLDEAREAIRAGKPLPSDAEARTDASGKPDRSSATSATSSAAATESAKSEGRAREAARRAQVPATEKPPAKAPAKDAARRPSQGQG